MRNKPQLHKIYDGKLIKLYKSRRKAPDGTVLNLEEVIHPGASLIVPFIGGKVVFIRQLRAVIGRYIWELPAGTLAKGEKPADCAKREAEEETGYIVKNVKKIGIIYTSPGFCNEVIHIFRADCALKKSHKREKDEFITVKHFSKKGIRSLFANGKISDSKTIAALAFAGIL